MKLSRAIALCDCKIAILSRTFVRISFRKPSSILFAYYGHDISNMVYVSLTNYFAMVFINCGKWLG